jgi:hypothetical protein
LYVRSLIYFFASFVGIVEERIEFFRGIVADWIYTVAYQNGKSRPMPNLELVKVGDATHYVHPPKRWHRIATPRLKIRVGLFWEKNKTHWPFSQVSAGPEIARQVNPAA